MFHWKSFTRLLKKITNDVISYENVPLFNKVQFTKLKTSLDTNNSYILWHPNFLYDPAWSLSRETKTRLIPFNAYIALLFCYFRDETTRNVHSLEHCSLERKQKHNQALRDRPLNWSSCHQRRLISLPRNTQTLKHKLVFIAISIITIFGASRQDVNVK